MIQANRQYFEEVLGNNTLFETETPTEAMNQLFLSIENYDLEIRFLLRAPCWSPVFRKKFMVAMQ